MYIIGRSGNVPASGASSRRQLPGNDEADVRHKWYADRRILTI